jgi:hypothetical protein
MPSSAKGGVKMIAFHAVMIDETGCEFGVGVQAASQEAALEYLRENYPESRVAQLESPEDREDRERTMREHIECGGDWDDEGRPIFYS